jgi:hypothetical protein
MSGPSWQATVWSETVEIVRVVLSGFSYALCISFGWYTHTQWGGGQQWVDAFNMAGSCAFLGIGLMYTSSNRKSTLRGFGLTITTLSVLLMCALILHNIILKK